MAILRGGEFLYYPKSEHRNLFMCAVCVRKNTTTKLVVVRVPQPKTRPDLFKVDVPCYDCEEAGIFKPSFWWEAYCALSPLAALHVPCPDRKSIPAFHHADGSPLSRDYMLSMTKRLLHQAGITTLSDHGTPTVLRMASWRAGGVRSAIDAGLHPDMIMALGRWTSDAWRRYLTHTLLDVRGAGARMWSSTTTILPLSHIRPVVGAALALQPVLVGDDVVVAAASASLCQRVAKHPPAAPAPSPPPSKRKATGRGPVNLSAGLHRHR